MRGAHYPEIVKSTGGFFFVWTLWALGGLGGLHRHPLGARTVEPAMASATISSAGDSIPRTGREVCDKR